jgi:hypothetical protein
LRCHAAVTSKRSLKNYLHSDAIFEASGFFVARQANERHEPAAAWESLSARARKRLRYKAKRWLNTRAVERMTPARLAERDPKRKVRSWLATIAMLSKR